MVQESTAQVASADRKIAVTSLSRALRIADSTRATSFSGNNISNKAWTAALTIRRNFTICINTHQIASREVRTMSDNLFLPKFGFALSAF